MTVARLVLIHYFILFAGPLFVVFVTFLLLEDNLAEYQRQSLGIKLSGPIAAYMVLFFFFRMALEPMWTKHIKEVRRNNISNDQAMVLAQSYSILIGRYVYVQLLWLEQRGYFPDHMTQILSEARKSMYGFQNLVGASTIYDGKYVLSDVLGAAINNGILHLTYPA